jgi:hypothetical protein
MNDDLERALSLRDVVAIKTLPVSELAEQRQIVEAVRLGLEDVRSVEELDALQAQVARAVELNASVEAQVRGRGGRP